MFTIKKSFSFDAAHQLKGLPKEHPCTRMHGHTYEVIVELQSRILNPPGFVKDYRELAPIKEYIDNELDHRNLNEVLGFNPTAENIAGFLFTTFSNMIPEVSAITVKETPKTSARYAPSN